jgi:hypothetical protein
MVIVIDYNNKKSKEKYEYVVRSMFICGAVYTEWVSLSSRRRLENR